jgi:hypothetical protein
MSCGGNLIYAASAVAAAILCSRAVHLPMWYVMLQLFVILVPCSSLRWSVSGAVLAAL